MEDYKSLTNDCIEWLRNWFDENGKGCKAVVGISGGKDSTVVAYLCAAALGPTNVIGVMMPNGVQADIEDSRKVINSSGITGFEMPITDAFSDIYQNLVLNKINVSNQSKINIAPRLRMTMLYAVAQSVNGRVVGTGNRFERLLGYYTLWGDGACDVNPIGLLSVKEVIEIGRELGIEESLLVKPPADGLTGKTDEESLGFSYEMVDKFLHNEHIETNTYDKINIKMNSVRWKGQLTNIPMFCPNYRKIDK